MTVWLASILGVLWLAPGVGSRAAIHGIVEARRSEVLVPVEGMLATVTVDRHARVEAGQVLGRLADDDLRLRLSQMRFELEGLRADLRGREAELAADVQRETARHELDAAVELRRRTSELESARLDELETQAEIEETRIRLHGLTVEAERQTSLERQGIAADAVLVRVETERKALERRLSELEGLLEQRRKHALAARARLDEFTVAAGNDVPVDAVLEPMRWRLKVQEAEIERIALEGRKLDLRAPCAGYVEALHLSAGQWTAAGAKLLTIVDPESRRILAYVPEQARGQVQLAGAVHVIRPATATRRLATILTVSPSMVQLPARLWRDPRIEEWGWEVVLAAGADEAAGERVSILPAP